MTDELKAAVDSLTQPSSEDIKQPIYRILTDENGRPKINDDGDIIRTMIGERKMRLNHAPLLDRLEEAITSTMARHGGGGADKHARNLLDSAALFEFMRITSAIGDWCRNVGVRPTRNPRVDLLAWHEARTRDTEQDIYYEHQLFKWGGIITAKLNTPRSWELTVQCPVCASHTWVDVAEVDGVMVEVTRNRPISVEYWPDQLDIFATATARCRSCGHEWFGGDALEELRKVITKTGVSDVAHEDENLLA